MNINTMEAVNTITAIAKSGKSAIERFVPQLLQEGEYSKTICESQQKIVVRCMERTSSFGGNCGEAFAKWNKCIAKDCGYYQK